MNKCAERLYNGLVKENPTFVLMLGMCPTLAVTTSAINGIGMGLSTTAVLVMSNMLISMLRKVIPASVRMPAFIVVVASFDRSKLYYFGESGKLCIKKSGASFDFRRDRYGTWIHGRSYGNRYCERTAWCRRGVRHSCYAAVI